MTTRKPPDRGTPIIRVFPRRTSFTPDDALAFVGDPPLLRPEADEVRISCVFTWDMAESKRLAQAWGQYYPRVFLGGPALGSPANNFTPGLYVRPGITFTSRGCNHRCPWCLVPEREGHLRLLDIQPGYIIQDNNFLQTGREHMAKVFAMLRGQRRAAIFSGGLESDLVDDWVAAELRTLRIGQLFLACDTEAALKPLEVALGRLRFLSRNKLRCYILLGFKGDTLEEGITRLEKIWDMGAMPFVQLYQPPDHFISYPYKWRAKARLWSRPAVTKAIHRRNDVNPQAT